MDYQVIWDDKAIVEVAKAVCHVGFTPNSETRWRQASLPDVEGGILAARKKLQPAQSGCEIYCAPDRQCGFIRRARMPGSTAGSDARRYGPVSEFGLIA